MTSEWRGGSLVRRSKAWMPEVPICLEGASVVAGNEASGNTDSRKGWTCPATPLSWQEMKGKWVQNKKGRIFRKRKNNNKKRQLSLEFFHLGQAIWRCCGRHFPMYGVSVPPAGSGSAWSQLRMPQVGFAPTWEHL